MDIEGRIKSIGIDFESGDTLVTIQTSYKPNFFEGLKDKLLDIKLKVFHKKRSLDANALLWHCIGELAPVLNADKYDIYLLMLKRYGVYTYIEISKNAYEVLKREWRDTEIVGEMDTTYGVLCYLGSSQYDTKEFSVLLEGVISEMIEAEIDPPTSKRMQDALDEWEKKHEAKTV